MDLHALKNEGWTNKEIVEELGYHRTVAKWLLTAPLLGQQEAEAKSLASFRSAAIHMSLLFPWSPTGPAQRR